MNQAETVKAGKEAVDAGKNLAIELVPAIKVMTDFYGDEGICFWAGFFAAMCGVMAAEIGTDAMQILSDASIVATKTNLETNRNKAH